MNLFDPCSTEVKFLVQDDLDQKEALKRVQSIRREMIKSAKRVEAGGAIIPVISRKTGDFRYFCIGLYDDNTQFKGSHPGAESMAMALFSGKWRIATDEEVKVEEAKLEEARQREKNKLTQADADKAIQVMSALGNGIAKVTPKENDEKAQMKAQMAEMQKKIDELTKKPAK